MVRLLFISILIVFFGAAGYLIHGGLAGAPGGPGKDPLEKQQPERYDPHSTNWDDYLWPTDAGTKRTSDFAEFRSTHFHAGIDVSTGGRTGYDVYAARDGWLHAAYFEPGGYGWFLVLRHVDGYYTCYAHLDHYSTKVLDAFRSQLVRGKHSYGYVEFRKDTVRVKKGEVIAFTGATGAGPAHLHFEVRDPSFNPVNPGLSRHLRPVDSLPPEIRQLILVPLDASSSVDGKYDQRLFNTSGAGDAWKIPGISVLRGRIGVMLRAHDRAEGASDYPTPYRIAMFVDGKEVFSAVSNRIQDSLGFHIRIDRDHALMREKKGEFRKLFREEGNLLETYWPRDAEAGVFSAAHFGAGEKKVRIVAKDLAGNTSTLAFTVMIASDVRLASTREGSDLQLKTTGGTAQLVLEEQGAKGWTPARQWKGEEAASGVRVDLKQYRGTTVRAVTVDAFGNRKEHATWTPGPLHGSAGRLYHRREVIYDQIVYDLKTAAPFTDPPSVFLVQGDREEAGTVMPVSASEYRAVLTAWPGFGGDARVVVRYRMGEKEIEWTDELRAYHISATLGGQLRSKDGRFVMSFSPADVYRDMLLTVDKTGTDTAVAYTVGPEEMPLAGRPLVSITPDPGMKHPVVVAPRPIKKYSDVQLPHSVGARIGRYLGTFSLAEDSEGPTVMVDIANRSREPVRIAISDSIAGVDWETVVARIDKEIVPLEFDERRGLLVLPYDVYKSVGRGEFSVSVKDKVGNETVVRRKM